MKKYEYNVVPIKIGGLLSFGDDSKKQIKQLNEFGAEGWKLITVSEGKDYLKYIFIREL